MVAVEDGTRNCTEMRDKGTSRWCIKRIERVWYKLK